MVLSHVRQSTHGSAYQEAWAVAAPPGRQMPAWLLSVCFHAAIFLAIGLLGGSSSEQPSAAPERTAGIALVQRDRERVTYYSEAASSTRAGDGQRSPATAQPGGPGTNPFPSLEQLPVGLAAELPSRDALRVAAGSGPALPGADSWTPGSGAARGMPGGGTTTQVFGAQGTGSRFVYVFDRSASMEGFAGRPIRAAKRELVNSLKDLGDLHQFLIVFYNEQPTVFNPAYPKPPGLVFGTELNKRLAESFIQQIQPAGGTRHDEALRLAMNVQPDVIFLLTDADDPKLSPSELESIRRRNRGGTVINAIEFGSRPSPEPDNFMMRLARQNGGQHVYINVSRLAD